MDGCLVGWMDRYLIWSKQETFFSASPSVFFPQVYSLLCKHVWHWYRDINTPYSPSVSLSFSTSPWCLCTCGPPSPAAVRSSGPHSFASHSRVATEQLLLPWHACSLVNRMKLRRINWTPKRRQMLQNSNGFKPTEGSVAGVAASLPRLY